MISASRTRTRSRFFFPSFCPLPLPLPLPLPVPCLSPPPCLRVSVVNSGLPFPFLSPSRKPAAGARLAAIALVLASASCTRTVEPPGPAPAAKESAAQPPSEEPLAIRYTDVTAASGLRFQHVTGAHGAKLLPETMGSGGAFLDHDGDGILDVFLVNSCWWPGHEPPGAPRPSCALFRGRGDGTFEDVSASTGAAVSLYGMGCFPADYDGDSDVDVYITAVTGNVLLRNDAGRFTDVTERAGARGGVWKDRNGKEHPEWSTAAAWADADLDGDLDLLIANYVQWTPETEIFTTLDGVTKAFTTPDRYPGLPCRLLLNRGDGSFADGTEAAGLAPIEGKALGIAVWDFDSNQLPDFVVANDTQPNFFFLNRGSGRLEEAGLTAGIAYDDTGRARAGMGIDITDFASDGTPAVAIGNFSDEPMSLHRWEPGETAGFTSIASRAGLVGPTYSSLTFGVLFLDADLDGNIDLAIANGHIEPDIARVFPHQSYAQKPQLFTGRGDGTFAERTSDAGPGFQVPLVARGLAAGDVDRDGDLDLLFTTNGGPPVLLRNDPSESAKPRSYLRIQLRGKPPNTGAIGAVVRLTAGGKTQTRVSRTGSSYLSQSEPALTFGIGEARAVEKLLVRWPGGAETSVEVPGVDRTLEIIE